MPNHSVFPAIEKEPFLEGARILAALEKVSSFYLKSEFRKNSRPFLEDLARKIPSIVAAGSLPCLGLSCFCPEIIMDRENYSAFYLLGQLLDGLMKKGWIKGHEVDSFKVEFHSTVRKQRQPEQLFTRKRPDVSTSSPFVSLRFGFGGRQKLYRVSIVHNVASL